MWRDSSLPRGTWPETRERTLTALDGRDLTWQSVEWTPETLANLVDSLAAGGRRLWDVPEDRWVAAWLGAVAELRHPEDHSRTQGLRRDLASFCRLSRPGLAAALDCVLDGVVDPAALGLFEQVAFRPDAETSPVLVILSSNLPGLAVQSLLPALASRRPVLVKSASAEPLFAPAFVDALCRREPLLRMAVAATTWSGGRTDLEAPVLERVGRVIAYGGGEVMADLDRRADDKLVAHGPKISLAVVSAEAIRSASRSPSGLVPIAAGLARDIALFDQRGCLSVQAVFTDAKTPHLRDKLAQALAEALTIAAERWPLGPAEPAENAQVRMMQDEAIMRAVTVVGATSVAGVLSGGVLIDPDPDLRPSPGRRWVRLHCVEELEAVPELLAEWRGRLQGVALAGTDAWTLEPALRELGVSHLAAPGELQSPDIATWANGGVAPLDPYLS